MNSLSPIPESTVSPSEDQWATAVAANLRLIQAAGADEPADQRKDHIAALVQRSLQSVPAGQRALYLERLGAHFPVGQVVAAPQFISEAAPVSLPQTPDDIAALVSAAWGRFSPEQRRVLRERLTASGVVEQSAPADATDFSEVKRSFMLAPNDNVVALRVGRLALMGTDFVTKTDQLTWSTWKQVAPQTILKKDAALGDLRALMRRYVKGDPEITDQQMAQQIDRTRHLVSSMLGALAVTSRGFVKRYQTRYSPDAVKDIVKMEGGLGAFGNEGKYWRKYVELSSDISEVSIQTDMMESISRFVEDMMKTKKPGSPA
jgi:hypothetical protein